MSCAPHLRVVQLGARVFRVLTGPRSLQMYTLVQVRSDFGDLWVVMADNGLMMTRPCSWKFALARIAQWTEPLPSAQPAGEAV